MSKRLIDFYNAQKAAFVEEITKEVIALGGHVEFNPIITVNGEKDDDMFYIDFASIIAYMKATGKQYSDLTKEEVEQFKFAKPSE